MELSPKKIKILITAIDLEQSEHRGIAVYSKNLIFALHNLNYEVWLLTSHSSNKLSDRDIFDWLNYHPLRSREINLFQKIKSLIPKPIKQFIKKILFFKKKSFYVKNDQSKNESHFSQILNLNEKFNHHLTDRTKYLENISGIVNMPNIYSDAFSLLREQQFKNKNLCPIKAKVPEGFNFIITTCPLAIEFVTTAKTIQTIHDIIPIEIPNEHTGDIPWEFQERIKTACLADQTWCVSQTTKNKILTNQAHSKNTNFKIIYQPSSFEHNAHQISFSKDILKKFKLEPNKYLITIGSIEPRKNIVRLAEAFIESNTQKEGFKLVIVGKIKQDQYSKELLKIAEANPSITLSNFVTDASMQSLLHYAHTFIFPSILEGYGIPLVDAIQHGKRIICSDIPVFEELANNQATFVSPHSKNNWIHAINNCSEIPNAQPSIKYQQAAFQKTIEQLLSSH